MIDLINPIYLTGEIDGKDVSHLGTKIYTPFKSARLVVVSNPSTVGMYLALKNSTDGTTNQAVVGKGIYIAPNGGGYELSLINIGQVEIWAIHGDAGSTHRLCLQVCS